MLKYICHFSVKNVVKEKIFEKSVLATDFISAQLGQFTTSDYIYQHNKGPHKGQQVTTFTFNHQPQPTIFIRTSNDS